MTGHIRERSPGHWAIVLDIRDPETGARRRKWHSFKGTKRGAQKECARLVTEMEGGSYAEPTKTTVGQFLETWLGHVKAQVTPKTHQRYTELVRKNIVPSLGAIRLTSLRPPQLATFYAKALVSGRVDGKGGLSPATVLYMHRIIKHALKDAVRWDTLVKNPADAIDAPKVERPKMSTYDMPETAALLDAARGTRLFVPIMLGVLCGLRRGEIVALRWRNVDLAGQQIAVVEAAEQTTAGVRIKPPKSGRSRTVAITGYVADELRAHRVRQAEELLRSSASSRATPSSTPARTASRSSRGRLTGISGWRSSPRAPCPRVRFHDLRHAHATHMLASGVHPKVASERLGHSKVGITLDLYSHVLPGMQADAASRLDGALQQALEKRRPQERWVAKR